MAKKSENEWKRLINYDKIILSDNGKYEEMEGEV